MYQRNKMPNCCRFAAHATRKKPVLYLCLLLLCLILWAPEKLRAETADFPVVGWIENILIKPAGIVMQAKLDTGADKSSLHAEKIEKFKKDGRDFVRFELRNRYGQSSTLELETQKTTRIRRAQAKPQRRPVVRMPLCLAGAKVDVEVTLVDRSNLSIPMLIGRNFLAGNVVVDASKTYISEATCR